MTRRERLQRILENLGPDRVRWQLERLVRADRLTLLSDDGIEDLTAAVVHEWKHEKKVNRENRARRAVKHEPDDPSILGAVF